ncbi:MAG: alpha-L-fucosidase [Bacteroidota bacterium]|nr:alpha-L-fucosidase [Bacteroidota bacterium]
MNLHKSIKTITALLLCLHTIAQPTIPVPVGPLPSANQLRWQQLEYYAFIHFSVNTYTDMSWGYGNEDPKIFNPGQLDCRQWARICKEAGMKGIILTAKHHSGFCLWPSQYTAYSVKNCPWKNGKGDIVREMANACKEYGLKLGLYLSPWDRNRADYGTPQYIQYFRNQLRELLSNYGEIFEIWFDGANGGSGYYGGANETRTIDRITYYDWKNTYKLVRELQPKIVIWNDGGDRADLRWVGTEAGYVGETNWSLLDSTGDVPEAMLRNGVENGNKWVPGEVNTSIRPEWFYHPKEDSKVKTVAQLTDIYYQSVGRNATLLLNFPIMPNGLIHPTDEANVLAFGKLIRQSFANNLARNAIASASNTRGNARGFTAANTVDNSNDTYWATDDSVRSATVTLRFPKAIRFNRFLAQEYIQLGQRVKSFSVAALVKGSWQQLAAGTTIGYKRILRFNTVEATQVRLEITDSKSSPVISNMGIFNAPQVLAPPGILRDKSGVVHLHPADAESELYYSLNGQTPTLHSNRYTAPVKTSEGKLLVKAVAYDRRTKKMSAVTSESFGIARTAWSVTGITDSTVNAVLDGNPETTWYQPDTIQMPVDLVIDLGRTTTVRGFKYLPDQHWWGSGIITHYSFFISPDGRQWEKVDEGEFSNIKNNPVLQTKTFPAKQGRFCRIRAEKNTQNNNRAGYAEVDILTE